MADAKIRRLRQDKADEWRVKDALLENVCAFSADVENELAIDNTCTDKRKVSGSTELLASNISWSNMRSEQTLQLSRDPFSAFTIF